LFPEMLIEKRDNSTTISLKEIHWARVKRGIFYDLDEKTKNEILSWIMLSWSHTSFLD
jgi:hypothetical protein